jgi:hypothetical protein
MHHSLWDIQNRHILVDHRPDNIPTAQNWNVQEVLGQRFLCSGDPHRFLHPEFLQRQAPATLA